jgi:hypothetical protein
VSNIKFYQNLSAAPISVVAKVRERLAVGKRMVKKMDVERFNLKQLNKSIRLKSQITLQLWKTYMIMGTLIRRGKLLERT